MTDKYDENGKWDGLTPKLRGLQKLLRRDYGQIVGVRIFEDDGTYYVEGTSFITGEQCFQFYDSNPELMYELAKHSTLTYIAGYKDGRQSNVR